jgi:hypothetical protein
MDLIVYFYEHESAKVAPNKKGSRPAYRFPLHCLKDYFGIAEHNLKKAVLNTQEYQDYVEAHQRSQMPPPLPEMSLLTAARIAAAAGAVCLTDESPEEDKPRRMGYYARDIEERKTASAAQVVRKADREAAHITSSEGLPRNDGKFVESGSRHGKLACSDLETDRHRFMVCDMQKTIEAAVDKSIVENGIPKQRDIFGRLVEKEKQKDREKPGAEIRTDSRAPYKARAALGLVLLLSSVLW